jgi:type II secretory pathway pseudopilin PulG
MAKNRKGYTIVELAISLAIGSAITSFAVFTLRAWRAERLLEKTASSVLEAVNSTASAAAASRAETRVTVKERRLLFGLSAPSRFFALELPPEISAAGVFGNLADRQTLLFRPNGSATPGTITLRQGSRECQIVKAIRGGAYLQCN